MTKGTSWGLLQAALVASSLLLLLYVVPFAVGMVVGFMTHKPAPKTVEIVRYVSLAGSASAKPALSAPSAPDR